MALPKQKVPAAERFQAVFKKGVLRPLKPLRLRENSRVTLALFPEAKWRADFERLLRRMRTRTRAVAQKDIEAEVGQARAEIKAKRRAARRPA